MLLQHGADSNKQDIDGNTPVHIAASDDHLVDCLQLLLNQRGAAGALKLDERNYDGMAALHIAVSASNLKSVQLLVANGADVNVHETKRGRSALHLAIKGQAKEILRFLLENTNVEINKQSYDGNTALHLAIGAELDEICAMLMGHGADPDIRNYLHFIPAESELSDDEDEKETEQEEEVADQDEEIEDVGQSSFDLAKSHPPILEILHSNSSLQYKSIEPVTSVNLKSELLNDNKNCSQVVDSGIDLTATKECSEELDPVVIENLAKLLDNPNRQWETLAKSLNIFSGMSAILEKQASPTGYILTNLDVWDLTPQVVLEKLDELHLKEAAAILKDCIGQ